MRPRATAFSDEDSLPAMIDDDAGARMSDASLCERLAHRESAGHPSFALRIHR